MSTQTIERPILFTASMIRAILNDSKTQTRRVMRKQMPEGAFNMALGTIRKGSYVPSSWIDRFGASWQFSNGLGPEVDFCASPYGQPGDKLYVRETWCLTAIEQGPGYRHGAYIGYRADGRENPHHLKSSKYIQLTSPPTQTTLGNPRWRPSIHMPKWASRITLLVKDVRAERVQDISEEDAIAEGVFQYGDEAKYPGMYRNYLSENLTLYNPRDSFITLWQSINEKRGHGWDKNPWVWVVEFEYLT